MTGVIIRHGRSPPREESSVKNAITISKKKKADVDKKNRFMIKGFLVRWLDHEKV